MSRKQDKMLGKLFIVAGLGLAGYYLYKVGNDKGWWASLFPRGNTPTRATAPDNGGGAPDPVQGAVDTALGVIGWLRQHNDAIAQVVDSATDAGTPVDEVPANPPTSGPTPSHDAAQDAGQDAWNAFGVAVPVWLGTSKEAADLTHEANVALTHAIGQETAIDKGIRTLFTSHGAFLANGKTHKCYDMSGHKITCPAPEDVIGIDKHSYEAFLAGVTK